MEPTSEHVCKVKGRNTQGEWVIAPAWSETEGWGLNLDDSQVKPSSPVTYFLMSSERRFLLKGGMFFLLVISRSRSATVL